MSEDFRNKRRNYFINRPFQAKFILKFCFLVVIGSVVSGGIVYLMSKSTVTTSFENSRLVIKSTADFVLPAVLLAGSVVLVITGLGAIAVTLFTSHRLAGPLYRLEKDVEEVARGNLKKRFQLRKTDEIKPLAVSLQKMTDILRKNVEMIKKDVDGLDAEINSEPLRRKVTEIKIKLGKFITG